jgi:hypothetical protein
LGEANNLDSHGREFGNVYLEDSNRTDRAIRAIYEELRERSRLKEGIYQPLDLETPLKGRFKKMTLDEALYHFVHDWNFTQPQARRAYTDQLAEQILAQRIPIVR